MSAGRVPRRTVGKFLNLLLFNLSHARAAVKRTSVVAKSCALGRVTSRYSAIAQDLVSSA
jgi:hypothetical protein